MYNTPPMVNHLQYTGWSYINRLYIINYFRMVTIHREHVFLSLEASSSVWENMDRKLRSVNFRRVLHLRWAFWPAFRVTGISDDRYRSNWDLWWVVQEYNGSDWNKFGTTSECRQELWVHLGVLSNQRGNHKQLWGMPVFLWIFLRRTAGIIWESLDAHEQLTSLNSEYDAWIIVH